MGAAVKGSDADARVTVTARVTNTGHRKGAEVVQVDIGAPESLVARPATGADAERLCAELDPTMLSMVDDFPLVVLADFGMIPGFGRDEIARLITKSEAQPASR